MRSLLLALPLLGLSCAALAADVNFAPARFEGDAGLDFAPLRFAYYPTANRIRVSHGALGSAGATGRFRILDAKGGDVFVCEVRDAKEWTASVPDLKSRTLATGDGSYVARFEAADGAVREIPFRRDVFDWETSSPGKSDVVPEPFVPVRAEGGKVSTVLREHVLTPLGLPAQIVAAEKEILAMPFALSCISGGKFEGVGGEGFVWTEKKNQYARFTAKVKSKNFTGHVDGVWWMDGLLDWSLTVEAGRFDALYMVIRQKPGVATLMHAVTDSLRFHYAGKIPAGTGSVWMGQDAKRHEMAPGYVPYVWFGGPLRGIAVFGENDRGWDPGAFPHQQIVRKPDGAVELMLHLVRTPTVVTSPRTIRLGFQATPVKPMAENWRAIPADILFPACWYWGSQTACNDLETYDRSDAFLKALADAKRTGKADWSMRKKMVEGYRCSPAVDEVSVSNRIRTIDAHYGAGLYLATQSFKEKRPTCFYTNGRGLNFNFPPGRTFCDEWYRLAFVNRAAFDIDASTAYEMDPVPTYLDYAASCWRRLLASGACDHLYWDDVFLAANFNPETSAAFVDSKGLVHPASGIFNMRAQVMRGSVLQKEMGRPCRGNWVHCTNTALAPVSAFAGVNYDWEDNGKTNPLHERYSRDYIQASAIGRQFGVRTKVLCYFGGGMTDSNPVLEEQALGVMLTHELAWERVKRWNEIHAALMKWGYGAKATRVWNYWDEADYPLIVVGGETSSLVARRADGETLVIVASWEKGPKTFGLKTCAPCAPSVTSATDFFTGKPVAVEAGAASVDLPGYSWRAILLR